MSTHTDAKHTPGPWKCELFYENGDKSSEVVPKNYSKPELHEPICIIPHDDVSEDSEPQMLANVRLIVAAPELFSALQAACDRLQRLQDRTIHSDPSVQKAVDADIKRFRAVLAKAQP